MNDLLIQFWQSNPEIKNVAKKISLVMADVDKFFKDGKNKFQNYDYVSEANAVAQIRIIWVKHGLIAIPYIENMETTQIGDTKSGQAQYRTTLNMLYQIIDSESGEMLLARFGGTGVDSSDKGIYKAITGANKYFLFKTFQIETADGKDAPRGSIDPELPNQIDKEAQQQSGGQDAGFPSKFGTDRVPTFCCFCKIPHVKVGDMICKDEHGKYGAVACRK